jgi:ribonucleoside-diphosphate reductase alpha chain
MALGYSAEHIKAIMNFVLGTLTLDTPLPSDVKGARPGETLAQFLKARGLSDADMASINAALPGTFELSFAFAAWALSPQALQACGVDPAKAAADPNFNLLAHLGLTNAQIDALNLTICGASTIEGAPHLKAEHLPVFDCANKCGRLGKRYIMPQGHITMMAAAQPFISGAISKTINLPNDATIQDIKDCYRLSWELGLKANALYRDGCKLSQPLSATTDEAKKEAGQDSSGATADSAKADAESKADMGKSVEVKAPASSTQPTSTPIPVASGTHAVETGAESEHAHTPLPPQRKPARRRLPDTRRSITHRFNISGHEGYLTVGLYENGQPGELFITMSKEGGLMDSLGTATSVALQYGVPLQSLVTKFSHQRFEPAGITENSDIPFAKSLVDYIFRWLGMQFIPGYWEEHSPRAEKAGTRDESPASSRITEGPVSRISASHATPVVAGPMKLAVEATVAATDPMDEAMRQAQTDSPACDVCGTLTVRSGICYKCLNCGNSMGCS